MDRNAKPGDQPAAATTTQHRIRAHTHFGGLLGNFKANSALASDHSGIVIRFYKIGFFARGNCGADLFARLAIAVIGHDTGAPGFGAFNLGCRRVLRHHNRRFQAARRGGTRHALGVIATGKGNNMLDRFIKPPDRI